MFWQIYVQAVYQTKVGFLYKQYQVRLNKGRMLILPEAYGQLTLKLPAACAPGYEDLS